MFALRAVTRYITKTVVCHPIEGEQGKKSDHKMIVLESLLPRPKAYTWEVHEYLQITRDGTEHFKELIDKTDWSPLTNIQDVDKMVQFFQDTLQTHIHSCFS